MQLRGPLSGILLMIGLCVAERSLGSEPPVPDAPYPQEVARRIRFPAGADASHVTLLEVGGDDDVRFFAAGRWYRPNGEDATEIEPLRCRTATEFAYAGPTGGVVRVALPWAGVFQLLRGGTSQWLATRRDLFRVVEGRLESLGWPGRWEVRQIAVDREGAAWVASSGGVFRQAEGGWTPVDLPDGRGGAWAVREVLGLDFDAEGDPWVAVRAGIAVRRNGQWRFYEGRDGLPYNDFTGIAAAPGGDVWLGTHLGLIRFDGSDFAYRQGPGWLPGDDVRCLVIDARGTAWVATDRGPGAIERRMMTLADKARFYEHEIETRIKRTPLGYTSEVRLRAPGDRGAVERDDSDNDGLWTAMYGAGECFAWAATREPAFKARARQAFEALRFLQRVTQGGEHSPPKGFVARTIRPTTGPDPNEGRLERDRQERKSGDRLWKVYEPRWPKSADGQWYWKGDTSSDELDGHYFFYARYFDLVADDAEKDRVRQVVRDLTDHLVTHGFRLVDHDGQATRWGHFDPEDLNENPDWWGERGLNSLSILSYLAVAEHVTGDRKYGEAARGLIQDHGYAANVMNPKVQSGMGSGNQSDDEMAFMCFYNLLGYTKEEAWREKWLLAFHAYAALEQPELNPFFNFAYAAMGRGRTYHNAWGAYPVEPWAGWLEDSIATLRGFPLDRANWSHRNSQRLDLVLLPPQQSADLYAPDRRGRGYRVNGKVLPVGERHFNHWNTDPWRLDYSGDGRELASGAVFLLPYYMGLYHGFLTRADREAGTGHVR